MDHVKKVNIMGDHAVSVDRTAYFYEDADKFIFYLKATEGIWPSKTDNDD
jgi:hypothetical protein